MAKFISLFPELRGTLWTLDEDGEVSGTVELMLGSLMMRGSFGPDFFHSSPPQITVPPPAQKTTTPSERPEPTQQQQNNKQEAVSDGGEDAVEPCDTS